jgi:predicted CoA-binding protein
MRMKTVAIIGAHNDRSRWGNKAVRAFLSKNFEVYPISAKEPEVEGIRAFQKLAEVPIRPDLISMYVRPDITLGLLPEIAEKGCDQLWLNPGTSSPEVLKKAEALGLNIVQGCSIIGIGVSPSSL